TVAGDVDDIVGAAHHEQIAVLVPVAAVPGEVIPREAGHVARLVAGVVVPHRGEAAGGQRQLDADIALLVGPEGGAVVVEDMHIEPRHRQGGGAGPGGEGLDAEGVGGDGPAGPRL